LLSQVAAAQGELGLISKAKASLKALRKTIEQIDSDETKVTCLAQMATTYGLHLGNEDAATANIDQAEQLAGGLPDSTSRVSALTTIALSLHELKLTDRLEQMVQASMNAARGTDDPRERSDSIAMVAVVLVRMQEADKSQAAFDEALESARAIEDELSKAHALADIAQHLADAGHSANARTILQEAESASDEVTDPGLRAEIHEKIDKRRRGL
jgi:hypothetical protein